MPTQHDANQLPSEGLAPSIGEAYVPDPPAEQASEATSDPASYNIGTDALPKGETRDGVKWLEKVESGTFELDQMLQTNFLHRPLQSLWLAYQQLILCSWLLKKIIRI